MRFDKIASGSALSYTIETRKGAHWRAQKDRRHLEASNAMTDAEGPQGSDLSIIRWEVFRKLSA